MERAVLSYWRRGRLLAVAALIGSCSRFSHSLTPDSRRTAPYALVTSDRADFVFPAEEAREWSALPAASGANADTPLHGWSVQIRQYGSNVVFHFGIRDAWRKEDEGTPVSLQAVVSRSHVYAGTGMYQCVCVTMHSDSGLAAGVVGRSVYISVRGRDAVQRLLSGMADTVSFGRYDFTQGAVERHREAVSVPVIRR